MYIVISHQYIKYEPRDAVRLISNDALKVYQTTIASAKEEAVESVIVYKLVFDQVYEMRDSHGYYDGPHAKIIAMIARQPTINGPVDTWFYDDNLKLQEVGLNGR